MKVGKTLRVSGRKSWRAWLERNHARAREVWLVYHLKRSGRRRIPYNDAVEEALCFGWIDSTVKKIGDGVNAQRFSPRRDGSPVSELNKERARRMIRAGKMAPAGMKKIGRFLKGRFSISRGILSALRKERETWKNFSRFPDYYRRIRIGWIEGARGRPEVFRTRLRYFLKMTKANRRFGMLR